MAAPLNAPLAPFLTLSDGMTIRITALSAASGATVAGVTVSGVSIDVDAGQVEEATPKALEGTAFTMGDVAA